MVVVEVFRLLVVVLGALGGQRAGAAVSRGGTASVVGLVVGAGVAYVLGGVLGRFLDRGAGTVARRLRAVPATEILAAAVVGTGGALAGLVLGLPLIALVRSSLDGPVVGLLAWSGGVLGVRLGAAKGRDVARAAGIAELLDPRADQRSGAAVVLDTSALLGPQVAVLRHAGLLQGGLCLPRAVVDEVGLLADAPEATTRRRARRALELLADAKAEGVAVVVEGETDAAGAEGPEAAAVALARRRGTRLLSCSGSALRRARQAGVEAVDLRELADALAPEHLPGEALEVDLVRPGQRPGQAVGYLEDGTMVVVNGAEAHLGEQRVAVVVSGTRRTSQGRLVFAELADLGRPAPVAG
jgi:uncharacterized protein YacL